MTKAELVSLVAEKAGLTKREADKAVDAVVEVVGGTLGAGGRVRVDGLGIFEVVQRAAKVGRNPQTGQRIDVPPRKAVRFRPSKSLRESVA
jgi:DNA-binding protein HU-beta